MPPPSKEGALPPANKSEASGEVIDTERWDPVKVGWAPRFGNGDSADNEATLLDHQTFIESKLDEKFFGDWYHNTGIIIFACLASWLVATLGGGLAWVFIVMATSGTYYRTSLRRVRRNFRDDINRELAKTRLETDTESLEWMNSFLAKFWPIFAPYLSETIVATVDQILTTATPAFLDSMRLKTFILGTKPPRMEHVKTYPKEADDIVLMDWRFSFTPTDTMDLTARQLKNKINPKVVLEIRIGKAMVSKALDIIVEDFCFSGLMRVKVKLQIPFPHIERVDICFIGRPEIDYVCKPLGGDTFGFDINFIPGLETFIKEQIYANLEPILVDPNVFPIEIAKLLSGNPIDLAIGVVAVTIHGANGLKNPDKFSGTPDPYAVVSLNSRDALGKTKTIHENANPRWNETLYIIITNYTDALTLQLFDFNEFRKDKELGTATFPLERLQDQEEHENLQLEVLAGGRARGVIQADIRFFPVMGGEKSAEGTVLPVPEMNTGIARITVEQAKDLDGSKSMIGQLNPYAVLLLNGNEVHISNKLKRTNNPVFSNPTKSVLITDRKKARIGLKIKDDRDLAADPIIGTYQIKADDLISLMSKGQEWFNLHGTKTGRVKLTLDWKPVALRGVVGSSGGYITPIGVVRVHLKNARDLRDIETIGKSDPYARILQSGLMKGRTVTFKNNLDPDWDQVIYVPMHSPSERLTIEVMDEEKLGKDRSLGSVEVSASDYIHENDEGGYEVHDKKVSIAGQLRMNARSAPKGVLNFTVAFYPTLNVVDPDEESEAAQAQAELEKDSQASVNGLPSVSGSRQSNGSRKSLENGLAGAKPHGSIDATLTSVNAAVEGAKKSGELTSSSFMTAEKKQLPKISITPENLQSYQSGLIVFEIIEGKFAQSDCRLEVLIDDHVFPSYISSKARNKIHQFGELGDAFVRELDMSQMTLRLVEKQDKKGEGETDDIIAELKGETLPTLQNSLYQAKELTLKGRDGQPSKVTIKLRYIPVRMQLDPSESISNSGVLRVDVLDATDLPAADRNGYSDPYCKFKLNGNQVFKTKTQKKTLHPAWNEFFEVEIPSRTAADFKCDVYDWDFGDKADFLGSTSIDPSTLEPLKAQEMTYNLDGKSGVLRLKMLFKPSYVKRTRQGTSTFSGTFAPAGKVVGAPVKGAGRVGSGIGKGASFIKKGFGGRGKGSSEEAEAVNGDVEPKEVPTTNDTLTPTRVPAIAVDSPATPVKGALSPVTTPHNRTKSFGSTFGGTPKGADAGTGTIQVLSAMGYPPKADVRVTIKMLGTKPKEVFKTKPLKASNGVCEYSEMGKIGCAEDAQFQLLVSDHKMFSSDDLGEALFFLNNQGSGSEQVITAGPGTVTVKTSFAATDAESLRPGTGYDEDAKAPRKSFLGRRNVSGR